MANAPITNVLTFAPIAVQSASVKAVLMLVNMPAIAAAKSNSSAVTSRSSGMLDTAVLAALNRVWISVFSVEM